MKPHSLTMQGLNQVVGHAVVASFLHINAYPGHSHLVPAILINATEVAFAFYDAEHDVMIHILPLKWRERQLLVERGLVLLWMLLHFDLLLRPLSLSALNNKAKLHCLLEAGQALDSFRALASSSVTRWMGISYPSPAPHTELSGHQCSNHPMPPVKLIYSTTSRLLSIYVSAKAIITTQ